MIKEGIEAKSVDQSETEGVRRATVVSDLKPDTEVPARGKRRRHTDNYKREIVAKVSELRQSDNGDIGSFLRKEGLYASMVRKWEIKFKQENGITVRERNSKEALELKVRQLEKELQRTKKKLEKSELIIEFQKKVSELLKLNEE